MSRATIRNTNIKEKKEKRNREKLLAGPTGSDFSLSGHDTDLEIDYYDYNVVNAGAAPGSYLGMDPAFLVWIPPLDDAGEILPDETRRLHEDLKPKSYIDPGSNQESPEEEMLLPKQSKTGMEDKSKISPLVNQKNKKIHPLIVNKYFKKDCHIETDKNRKESLKIVSIQLHEIPKKKTIDSPVKVHKLKEKETKVEKSPSLDSSIIDEIKYVDDDDDEGIADNQCNINSYQDSNIISSN